MVQTTTGRRASNERVRSGGFFRHLRAFVRDGTAQSCSWIDALNLSRASARNIDRNVDYDS